LVHLTIRQSPLLVRDRFAAVPGDDFALELTGISLGDEFVVRVVGNTISARCANFDRFGFLVRSCRDLVSIGTVDRCRHLVSVGTHGVVRPFEVATKF
jgi:hypothetical protein